ncbi:MAG: diguanylate cyclase [Candidatus Omnitrophica bacterium]|nr:diguanylate cyclase [Candidatus Omnitrophota bacterium]
MAKITYCVRKKRGKTLNIPHAYDTLSTLKDVGKSDSSLIIIDEEFLNKKTRFGLSSLFINKSCLVHFAKTSEKNQKITEKYGLSGFFTDEEPYELITYKIDWALEISALKERIVNLEAHLLAKNRKIEKITLIDPTTNCYNWRYFINAVRHESHRCRRHLYSVSYLGIDIDHFRHINELYGVTVADRVIKEIVGILRSILRKEDILARWRSDEFFIIMPHLKNKDAYRVASRLQKSINTYRFKFQKITLSIKTSIGVVSSPEDNVFNTRDIINALDKCLTTAKRRGGSTVVLHSESHLKPAKQKITRANLKDLRLKIDKMNVLLTRDLLEMIYGFARAIEAKDLYTGRHVEITAILAEEIAKNLNLSVSEVENIKHAAVLHDLGKVGIDKSILIKKGALSKKEREIIKTHPSIAAEILREIHALRGAVPAVLYHHEHFDGNGYPLGLKGEEIPLSARIIAVADVYQALTSDRPYRKAYNKRKALQIIKKESGTHFDPKIVKIFLKVIQKLNAKDK